jgi:hypothetical protein
MKMNYYNRIYLKFNLTATFVTIIKQMSNFIQFIINFFISNNTEILPDLQNLNMIMGNYKLYVFAIYI